MRRRFVQIDGELREVTETYEAPRGPFILGDIPAYQSPIDGKCIEGRAQRRNDLARSGCRPWEGMEQERKEGQRRQAEQERAAEKRLDESAWRAWHSMSPDKRKKLMG